MKFLRVRNGRYHSDPPVRACGVLRQTTNVVEWDWANRQPGFDPLAFGRRAMWQVGIVKPCLHCFPACKPKGP